jgi:hypothetical protein
MADMRDLHAATEVPVAALVRQGIDLLLAERKRELDEYRRKRPGVYKAG